MKHDGTYTASLEPYYIVFQGKIGRVLDSWRAACDVAFSDYGKGARVLTREGLRKIGLDPDRQSDWTGRRG